jgi:hypothetical protein
MLGNLGYIAKVANFSIKFSRILIIFEDIGLEIEGLLIYADCRRNNG